MKGSFSIDAFFSALIIFSIVFVVTSLLFYFDQLYEKTKVYGREREMNAFFTLLLYKYMYFDGTRHYLPEESIISLCEDINNPDANFYRDFGIPFSFNVRFYVGDNYYFCGENEDGKNVIYKKIYYFPVYDGEIKKGVAVFSYVE